MSDCEALKIFARQPVSSSMVEFLAATTSAVIQVKQQAPKYDAMGAVLVAPVSTVPLRAFIRRLVDYSNVQTPTLMASLVYLNRLRNLLPGNAIGMETTRHRIFLAALILSAKSLNDSSPLNKHWTKYTDGLLSNQEINSAERELIALLNWDLTVKKSELLVVLQPFLSDIKHSLHKKQQADAMARSDYYRLSTARSASNSSIASYSSTKSSLYSLNSSLSLKNSASSQYSLGEVTPRTPLRMASNISLNSKGSRMASKPCQSTPQYPSQQQLASLV